MARPSVFLFFLCLVTLGFGIGERFPFAVPPIANADDAEGGRDPQIDPEPMIKACWDLSEELRASPATPDQLAGAAKSVECLQNLLLDQLEPLFAGLDHHSFPFTERPVNREGFKLTLSELATAYQNLIWEIYNAHRGCDPGCGTMWYSTHLIAYADLLEELIRAVAGQRNEYGY